MQSSIINLKNDLSEFIQEASTSMRMKFKILLRSETRLSPETFLEKLETFEEQLLAHIEQNEQSNKHDNNDQNENKKSEIQNQLKNMIPFFREEYNPTIFDDLEDPIKSTKLIAGNVQSGKSAVICGIAIYMVKALNKSVVIVVRNYTADYLQLAKKFNTNNEFGCFDVPVHYAKDCRSTQIFSASTPAITICIENETQLCKIADTAEDCAFTDFCLIADEADFVCYKLKNDAQRISAFNRIKSKASQFVAVTATAFDMLYMESTLNNKSIYKVPIHDTYKGIDHPDFTLEEVTSDFKFNLEKVTASKWELSSDMENFYSNINDMDIFYNSIEEKKNDDIVYSNHPIICLQKTETQIKKQLQGMAALARHSVFGKEFTVIVYNGTGVYLYHNGSLPAMIGESCGQRFSNQYIDSDFNVMHYNDICIGDVLQALKDSDQSGEEKYSHIVIIAGIMVGRGLNICSNDYRWHLTHEILKVSPQQTCADITQSCRLFGKYTDAIPTRLYCLQKDGLSLKQSHYLHKRILEGADLHEMSETMKTLCEQIKIFVGHIPSRKTTKKGCKPKWNRVISEEAQYMDEMIEEKVDVNDGYISSVLHSNGNTSITRFFKSINPLYAYSKEDLLHIARDAGYQQPASIFSSMTNPNTTYRCGWIFRQDGDRWTVREGLREEWN